MGSQLVQSSLVRMATWLAAAMLPLASLPGGACACTMGHGNVANSGCNDGQGSHHNASCHGGPRPIASTASCCQHLPSRPQTDSHRGRTHGVVCGCDARPIPNPPAAPVSHVHSAADQLLSGQAAVSIALPPDARLSNLAAALSHGHPLTTGSALDRCILLSRLIL